MSSYAGFDTDRVQALVQALSGAGHTADALDSLVASTSNQGRQIADEAGGVTGVHAFFDRSWPWSPERRGVGQVAAHAPDMSAEVGRRRTHLLACEQLAHDGFLVDPSHLFDDSPPPDEGKIKAALKEFHDALTENPGFNGNHDDLLKITKAFSGLNPDEIRAAIGTLTPADLRTWNDAMGRGDGWFSTNGLSTTERNTLMSIVLPALTTGQVHELAGAMPILEPSLSGVSGAKDEDLQGVTWTWTDGTLYLDGAKITDINQGDLGDCWFLAGLGAELNKDPNFVTDHMHDNGNGTYTVTFYKDGNPVEVTVTGRLPVSGGALPFSGEPPRNDHSPNGEAWVALYEKAFAQFNGTYKGIEGGYGNVSMSALTGQKAGRISPDLVTVRLLDAELTSGHPITLGTSHDGAVKDRLDHGQIVSGHEYIVTSVNSGATPPTITLRNPWGDGSGAPAVITITESDFHKYFDEVSIGGNGS